jgi:hypothetical protein
VCLSSLTQRHVLSGVVSLCHNTFGEEKNKKKKPKTQKKGKYKPFLPPLSFLPFCLFLLQQNIFKHKHTAFGGSLEVFHFGEINYT